MSGGLLFSLIPTLSNSFSSSSLYEYTNYILSISIFITHVQNTYWLLYLLGYKIYNGDNWFNATLLDYFCISPLEASNIIKIKSAVRATDMTCLPRPLPCEAPSIIPGRSRS